MANDNKTQSLTEMKLLATVIGGLSTVTAFSHELPIWINVSIALILGGSTARLQLMIDPSNYIRRIDTIPVLLSDSGTESKSTKES